MRACPPSARLLIENGVLKKLASPTGGRLQFAPGTLALAAGRRQDYTYAAASRMA